MRSIATTTYKYIRFFRYNDTTVRYGNESVILDKLNFYNIDDAAIFTRSSQSFDMRNYAVKYQARTRKRKRRKRV